MDIKKNIQKQFGRNAESYINSPLHKDGEDLQKLLEMASISGRELVLDVATGGGHTANGFAPFVKKVTALDMTSEMLAAAETFIIGKGHSNVEFVQGDAENLPFPEKSFDLVTCRIAPHHFPHIDQFIQEVFRVLKPTGQFLLDDNVVPEDDELDSFYNHIEKKRDYSHYRAWKKSEWLKMIELAGFEITEWHRFEKTFQFEPWCKRMQLSKEDQRELNQYILNASPKIKTKFNIRVQENHIISFQGEAILLKAVKR